MLNCDAWLLVTGSLFELEQDVAEILNPVLFIKRDLFLLVEYEAFGAIGVVHPYAAVGIDNAMEWNPLFACHVGFAEDIGHALRAHRASARGDGDATVCGHASRRHGKSQFYDALAECLSVLHASKLSQEPHCYQVETLLLSMCCEK